MLMLLVIGCGLIISLKLRSTDQHLESNPIKGVTLETFDLLELTQQLQASLGSNRNPGQTTKDYLSHLKDIELACERINLYKERSANATLADNETSRINQAHDLCEDLLKLTRTSQTIYTSVRKLLSADPTPRRFQTLPPFKNLLRQQHMAAISKAIADLSKPGAITIDFPFSALPELKQLHASLQNSKGLDYLPALKTFQLRLLGERNQYWSAYADVDALIHSLTVQFNGYCQGLQEEGVHLKQCRYGL